MNQIFAVLAVTLFMSPIAAKAEVSFACGDAEIFGALEGPQTIEKNDKIAVDLNAGVVVEAQTPSGSAILGTFKFGVGSRYTKKLVYQDGTEKVLVTDNVQTGFGEIRMDLRDPRLAYVELGMLRQEIVQDNTVLSQNGALIRFWNLPDGRLAGDLRIYDRGKQWDIIGNSADGRALRGGVGVGMNVFMFTDNENKESFGTKSAAGVVYGKISGVYAFTKNLSVSAGVDVFPLVGNSGFVFSGGIADTVAAIEYRITDKVSAYLQNRYRLNALIKDSDSSNSNKVNMFQLEDLSAGAIVRF